MSLYALLHLWYAQHVWGISMPIIRSSRLYVCYFRLWCTVRGWWLSGTGAGQQGVRLGREMLQHPSSWTHTFVNCNCPTPPQQRKVANTVRTVPDAVITIYVCSWWWVKVSPETCRAVCRNIIKLYVVASCWTVIDIKNFFEHFLSSSKNCALTVDCSCPIRSHVIILQKMIAWIFTSRDILSLS